MLPDEESVKIVDSLVYRTHNALKPTGKNKAIIDSLVNDCIDAIIRKLKPHGCELSLYDERIK